MEKFKQDLDMDVCLGVLEKVSPNTPITWCTCMLVVVKKTGKPRREIDFHGLNKFTAQQTHLVESPFMHASWLPASTWKKTVDV